MKERIIKFMQGRYGIDQLYRFLVSASLVSLVLAMLLRKHAGLSNLLTLAAFGLLSIFVPYADRTCRKDLWNWEYDVAESGVAEQKARLEKSK